MEEFDRKEKYNDYVAITFSNIGQVLCAFAGGEWPMPPYVEFMYPELKKEDTKSYDEIKQSLIHRLLE